MKIREIKKTTIKCSRDFLDEFGNHRLANYFGYAVVVDYGTLMDIALYLNLCALMVLHALDGRTSCCVATIVYASKSKRLTPLVA